MSIARQRILATCNVRCHQFRQCHDGYNTEHPRVTQNLATQAELISRRTAPRGRIPVEATDVSPFRRAKAVVAQHTQATQLGTTKTTMSRRRQLWDGRRATGYGSPLLFEPKIYTLPDYE